MESESSISNTLLFQYVFRPFQNLHSQAFSFPSRVQTFPHSVSDCAVSTQRFSGKGCVCILINTEELFKCLSLTRLKITQQITLR